MSALTDAPLVEADDRASWRAWLEANHATSRGAWLVTRRPRSGRPGLDYETAIEEALCFGWVDGTAGRVDDERGKLYFAPRKPRSGWAATNKARVRRLIAQDRMAPAGLAAIKRAKSNGSWELLDSVERLEVPDDLIAALKAQPPAAVNFAAWPPSVRKQALTSLVQARRPDTRIARIRKIADAAERNVRPGAAEPTRPLFESGRPDLAERADELLRGFGER
ncbi:MAG TPA: YdeI/OmpD-associated family protein [Candidatus Eisenbacteria bacterium]|nr:YdeI/OmpD-associated family protein [Candidatus Eisenbacteria bacterium]